MKIWEKLLWVKTRTEVIKLGNNCSVQTLRHFTKPFNFGTTIFIPLTDKYMKQVLLHFAIFLRFKLLLNNLQRTLAQYTKMFKYFERQFFSINQWTWLSGIDINGIKKNDGYCIWTIAVFSVLYLNAQMLKKKTFVAVCFPSSITSATTQHLILVLAVTHVPDFF